jgi:hypothetical protein
LSVTLLACGVFLFAAVNLIECWQAWQNRNFLRSLGLPLPVAYWIARGGLGAGAGLAATFGLWTLRRWARLLTLALVPLNLLRWLFESFVLGRSRLAEQNLPLALAWMGLAAVLVLGVLLDPRTAGRFSRS